MIGTALTAALLSPARAQPVPAVSFNIAPQPLSQALMQFSRTTGIQLFFSADLVRGRTSPGAQGSMSQGEALRRLLAGSDLSYRFTNPTTVAIAGPAAATSAGLDSRAQGSTMLDPITITSNRDSRSDLPYQTPGSVSTISEETIQRFRGTTAGDMFQGTPGVVNSMNRNGAALDVNIRGLQGMNRVATTVDGSEQSTSSYRGYSGVDNRSYVDPDLISGVTITKGPNEDSAGAIGGTVALETLNVGDILKPGDTYGVRVRGGISSNGTEPRIGATSWLHGPPPILDFPNKSGSVAFAVTQPNIDLVGALVRRSAGNYFAGTQGALVTEDFKGGTKALSNFKYGDEVFNTSQDSLSALLKATLRPADGHELQVGYLRHENAFGEVLPLIVQVNPNGNIFKPQQLPLSTIALDQLSARYHWKPSESKLIDLKVRGWMSSADEIASIAGLEASGIAAKSKSYGIEASNTSRFEVGTMPFTLRYGGSAKLEDAESDYRLSTGMQGSVRSTAPDGTREINTLFVNGKWEPTRWLALDAGVTYLTYHVANRATPIWSYPGPPYQPYEGAGVSPSFGVTVTPLEGWQLFGRYTTGIRPPSLRESTWNASGLRFNPDIVAEKARNVEVGTNLLKSDLFMPGDKARFKLAYFNNITDDYIGRRWDNTKPSDTYLILFNYDKVVMKGIEISGGYDAKKAFVDYAFNYYTDVELCRTAAACTNSTVQADYIANHIPPRFSASVTAGLRLFEDALTLGARYTYMSERAAGVEEDNYSKTIGFLTKAWAPYSLVDIFAEYKINERVTLNVSAENLLDRYYVDALGNTDMPGPGRTIRASLTGKFGDSTPLPPGTLFNRRPGAAPGADWSGFYLGGHVGQGFAALKGTTTALDGTPSGIPATESVDLDLRNFMLGGQAGFNYQFGNRIVIGIEVDHSKTRIAGFQEALATEGTLPAQRNLQAKTDYELDWMSTIRGRLGFAFDRLLVYGTGGLAFLSEKEWRDQYRSDSASASNPSGSSTSIAFTEFAKAHRTGWTLGAGAEYAIDANWSLKGEYAHTEFGEEDFIFANARAGVTRPYSVTTRCTPNSPIPPCRGIRETIVTNFPGTYNTVNGRKASNAIDLHTLKLGLNYRF